MQPCKHLPHSIVCFTASSSVTGVIPSSSCLCHLHPREEVTLFCSWKSSQVSLASCSLRFTGTVSFPSQEIQRSIQYLWYCKGKKSILLQLAGIPLHNQLMDLPPCRKCSHCESGAVKFHLKFFTVLLQLMFLLWLLLPYLCLIVLSSTIATVSFPCCDSFQSAPFPKDRKKIPFSSNPPLFYKPLFQVCFINNTNTTQSWKISCPCPACLIEPDHPQGQEVYLCIFFELLSA